MKKIIWIVLFVVGLIGVAFWQQENIPFLRGLFHETMEAVQYTCPMHPQVVQDSPGNCPICGMKLVPIATKPKKDGSLFIDPKRLQLIGVRKAAVAKKELVREGRLPGKVAYDQELFVTEQEYAESLRLGVSGDILATIEKKLLRLGLSPDEFGQLKKLKEPDSSLYLPKEGEKFWVYASVYEADLSWVESGMKASVSLPKESSVVLEGEVKQITPILDSMTRTATARILVSPPHPTLSPPGGEGVFLRPETYVDVILQKDFGEVLSVPADAVIETGVEQVVLVDLGEGNIEPREVKLGLKAKQDYPVLEGLKEGEMVLTSAHFLMDSEAALQAALKRFGAPMKGHQH